MRTSKKWKQVMACILSAGMVLSLAACGETGKESPPAVQEETAKEGKEETKEETKEEAKADSGEPAKEEKEPVTIRFWNGWTGVDGEVLKEMVALYNEQNEDNVTIDMDIMEFSSLEEKMNMSIASNTNPELHLGVAVGDYSRDGIYIPIDDIWEKTDLEKSDFNEDILDACTLDGKLYGMPFQLSGTFLYWNKDLFEAAGLDPETPPKTWEELAEFAEKLEDPSKNIVGGGFFYDNQFCVAEMLLSYGGGIVSEDGENILTDPEYIDGNLKALEVYKNYIDYSDTRKYTTADYESMFLANTCGMICTGGWFATACKTNGANFGVSVLPAGDERISTVAWPMSICVMKNTEGRELEACYSFMEFWNDNIHNKVTGDGKSPVYRWTEIGYQPYLKSVAEDEELNADPVYAVTSTFLDYYDPYFPTGYVYSTPLQYDVLSPMLEQITYEHVDPKDALQWASDELDAIAGK